MSRVDAWMSQRDQLAADLRAMADNIASGAVNIAGAARQAGATAVATAGGLVGNGRKRTMSAAARKRISEAQKARWAKQKRETSGTGKAAKKAKRSRKAKGQDVGNG